MKIVDIALLEVGVKESPDNSNKQKYGKWFGLNGVAWCGIFVSWCYFKAGYSLGNIGYLKGFAGVQTAYNHFKVTGELVTKETVKPGDIVMFDWGGDGHCDHTGIFSKDLGNGCFECIEGNTSLTNQSNGGEVMIRKRNYCLVKGFAHPKIIDITNLQTI